MISKGADPNGWTDEEEQCDESSERESVALRIRPGQLKEFYRLSTEAMRDLVKPDGALA
ncbi:MAG TPA: hypothetical protein VIX12_05540 [Candidatus Binataceae bacterium]